MVLMLSGSPDSEYILLRAESRGPDGRAGGGMLWRLSSPIWGTDPEDGTRAAAAGAMGRTGLKRELPLGGTPLGLAGPGLVGPRYMLLTKAAPNSEFELRCEAGALPMDIRLDWARARGIRGAVLGSSFKLG
jgi:hypothetical protein